MTEFHVDPNAVIQALSILMIAGISYFMKQMLSDIRSLRHDMTELKTEHDIRVQMSECPLQVKPHLMNLDG